MTTPTLEAVSADARRKAEMPSRRFSSAFTLIEMLVVMTILVLLVALMLPVVTRVKDANKTTVCANNMKDLSQLILQFASLHDGRGPGGGTNAGGTIVSRVTNSPTTYTDPMAKVLGNGSGGGSVSWANIVNSDILARSNGTDYSAVRFAPDGTIDAITTSRQILCPCFIGQGYDRPYAYNGDASGGPNYDTGGNVTHYPYWGIYGKAADPVANSIPARPGYSGIQYMLYYYGAKLSSFGAEQFMITETEESDGAGVIFGGPADGSIPKYPHIPGVGDSPTYPPYAAMGGQFSFRHPYYLKANFACFDGHVELLGLKDNINSAYRMSLGGQ